MDDFNNFTISDSTKREDYEILIKEKKDNTVMAYCPQINLLIKHKDFESIYLMMDNLIDEHINAISLEVIDDNTIENDNSDASDAIAKDIYGENNLENRIDETVEKVDMDKI